MHVSKEHIAKFISILDVMMDSIVTDNIVTIVWLREILRYNRQDIGREIWDIVGHHFEGCDVRICQSPYRNQLICVGNLWEILFVTAVL